MLGRFAVVHNGIIENYEALKIGLVSHGYVFESDTDTETIAHLLHLESQTEESFDSIVDSVISQLDGAFALAIIDEQTPNVIWAARQGSPLVIGVGHGEHFVGSDQLALLHVTDRFVYLEEGDRAQELTTQSFEVFCADGIVRTKTGNTGLLRLTSMYLRVLSTLYGQGNTRTT